MPRRNPLEPFITELRDGELLIEVMESFDGHLIFFGEDGESIPEASFSADELLELDERAEEVRFTGEDKYSRMLRRTSKAARVQSHALHKDAA